MPATTLLAVQVFLVLTSISITSAFRFYPFRRRQSDREEQQPVPVSPEAFMSTPELITNRGYPVESHSVVTEDGYVLGLHRIPYSLRTGNRNYPVKKKVVLFQHGLMASDSLWLVGPTDKCLAYMMSDLGYDVWLANSRGTRYSRRHIRLDPTMPEFWDYSWDEKGRYDVPATIKYVLSFTGQEKLVFIGGSLGATVFFIAMIQQPELNAKIDRMFALGPTSSRRYSKSVYRHMVPYFPRIHVHLQRQTKGAFLKDGLPSLPRRLINRYCDRNYRQAAACRDVIMGPTGFNPGNFNLTLMPVFNRHFPVGTSLKSIAQFAQNYATGVPSFNAYDYGPGRNLRLYGTLTPMAYDLRQVTAPVYLFYSRGDLIVAIEDVKWLESNLGNVRGSYCVADANFTHFDFFVGSNINEMVNGPILGLMPAP